MRRLAFVLLSVVIAYAYAKEKPPLKHVVRNRVVEMPDTTLSFSGYSWVVKAPAGQAYPGPNYWNPLYAWVDGNGFLHLKAALNPVTSRWECAEVHTTQSLGYGTYQWQVESDLGAFDKNIVLGMFNFSGNERHDEMDIEIARWGNAAWDNLNYTIWPATGSTAVRAVNISSFSTPNGTYTTHRFNRTSTGVKLQGLYGFVNNDDNQFQAVTFNGAKTSISTLAMPVYISLWLFNGLAPSNNQTVEVIIHSFKFTPQ
jgi:hypothetical protein